MNNQIRVLLQKQLTGTITDEERDELATMMESLSEEELTLLHVQTWTDFKSDAHLSDDQSASMLHRIKHGTVRRRLYVRIAAVAAVILMIAGVTTYLTRQDDGHRQILSEVRVPAYSQPVSYTRHITLKDGSTVVLKSGSRLFLSKHAREVSLDGEAYFDIVHRLQNHFVIHSGHITTTVLGTAFNIRAKNGNVTVSVTRGRVKVTDGNRMLAILGVNDEIRCLADNSYTTLQNTNVAKQVERWTQEGMTFDHRTIAEIARSLSTRYGIHINITDNRIAQSQVYVSFIGTEPLAEVMTTLSNLLPDMRYSISGTQVTIKGK